MTREIISFTAALYRAADKGLVTDLLRLDDDVFQGKIPEEVSPITTARVMAQWLPGQGFPIKGAGGVTWRRGRVHYGTLLNPATVPNVLQAQGLCRHVVGADYEPGWTLGNLARQLLKYVRPGKQEAGYTPDAERLILGTPYGYHECTPGIREDVTYYDARAYYYDMARRLPSLNLHCGKSRLTWHDTDGEEWSRWKRVINEVGNCKPLRNVLAGNMAGSMPSEDATVPFRVWFDKETGKVKLGTVPHSWGRFRAVGLLLVRSGAELTIRTCHEANKSVVYANTDSVHMVGVCPSIWQDHGFVVGVKGNGRAETCHRGSYILDGRATKPYEYGHREYIPSERLPIPSVQYAGWLRG